MVSIFDIEEAYLAHFRPPVSQSDRTCVAIDLFLLVLGGCSPFVLVR